MAQIANETGLSSEQLYRSFSENGNPTLKTTPAVMKALGIDLTARYCHIVDGRASEVVKHQYP
ncbi:addiction module antidote protein [Caballeronia sp.]|uniref:addiction module antidote protein n=1 Tax=Caballeronia sp. TaxID=1931223 RepID=UPI003C6BCBC0